ncbi:MAG: ABC transporter ATP-binding protein/permease [Kiritimatiellaeota bacterium]|nr:ABC transporter ATP-binding protein/permease [Kiritimatiellota bacterium]
MGFMTADASQREIRHYTFREILGRMWPLLRPHRLKLVVAGFLVAAVGLAVSLHPLFGKYVVDVAIPAKSMRMAWVAAGIFVATMFVRMGLWYIAMRLVFLTQQDAIFMLRSTSFSHLQRLCLRFHGQFTSGFLYERVFGNSINTLGSFMQSVYTMLVTNIVGLAFSVAFCLYLSPLLTVVIFSGCIFYVITAQRLSTRLYERHRAANEAGMDVVNVIMDKLRGQKTIQAFALEDRAQEELQSQLRPAQRRWMESILESMKLNFATEGLGYLLTAAVTLAGGYLVICRDDRFPLGTLVAFMGYQGMLIGIITAITNMYGQAMSARTAFDQLFTILDTHSTVEDSPGAAMPEAFTPELSFRSVTFGYTDTPVIKDVTLTIPAGKTVALVGRSGSGKSTLANLMLRLYDPQQGAVCLGGHDIRAMPQRAYRTQFGVVLQDPFLFDTTIEGNMRMVRPDVSEEELLRVLTLSGAWEFVKDMPLQIKSKVGEGGNQLSGGQRQRLAIARCLLTPSRVVILDEATSALDVETEGVVQQGIEALCADRTVVVIAHRLSTIRNAHRIILMDQGRVAEEGTYDELLAKGGLFSRLHSIAVSTSTHRIKLEEAGFV